MMLRILSLLTIITVSNTQSVSSGKSDDKFDLKLKPQQNAFFNIGLNDDNKFIRRNSQSESSNNQNSWNGLWQQSSTGQSQSQSQDKQLPSYLKKLLERNSESEKLADDRLTDRQQIGNLLSLFTQSQNQLGQQSSSQLSQLDNNGQIPNQRQSMLEQTRQLLQQRQPLNEQRESIQSQIDSLNAKPLQERRNNITPLVIHNNKNEDLNQNKDNQRGLAVDRNQPVIMSNGDVVWGQKSANELTLSHIQQREPVVERAQVVDNRRQLLEQHLGQFISQNPTAFENKESERESKPVGSQARSNNQLLQFFTTSEAVEPKQTQPVLETQDQWLSGLNQRTVGQTVSVSSGQSLSEFGDQTPKSQMLSFFRQLANEPQSQQILEQRQPIVDQRLPELQTQNPLIWSVVSPASELRQSERSTSSQLSQTDLDTQRILDIIRRDLQDRHSEPTSQSSTKIKKETDSASTQKSSANNQWNIESIIPKQDTEWWKSSRINEEREAVARSTRV